MTQRAISRFSVEFFNLTVPKLFLEEPISAVFPKNSGGEKVYGKEEGRGSIDIFSRKLFVSKCQKIP